MRIVVIYLQHCIIDNNYSSLPSRTVQNIINEPELSYGYVHQVEYIHRRFLTN